LLEVAIDNHVEELEPVESMLDAFPLGDLESEVKFLSRIAKQFIDQNHKIYRAILSVGEVHEELIRQYREKIIRAAGDIARQWAEEREDDLSISTKDFELAIHVAINSIAHFQLLETALGYRSGDVDEHQYNDVVTGMVLEFLREDDAND
jgi:hypothetical protein